MLVNPTLFPLDFRSNVATIIWFVILTSLWVLSTERTTIDRSIKIARWVRLSWQIVLIDMSEAVSLIASNRMAPKIEKARLNRHENENTELHPNNIRRFRGFKANSFNLSNERKWNNAQAIGRKISWWATFTSVIDWINCSRHKLHHYCLARYKQNILPFWVNNTNTMINTLVQVRLMINVRRLDNVLVNIVVVVNGSLYCFNL